MREPQEVEGFRATETPRLPSSGGEPSELDQARLLVRQFHVELREPLAKVSQEPLSVLMMLKARHEVISLCRVSGYAERVLRLIQKWLRAGVIEDGRWTASDEGSPQGATGSPLLANVYLHYAFDLWVQQWRTRHARGEVIAVRYADLCGHRHKSAYAEFLVMPSGCWDCPWLLGSVAKCSA